MLTTTASSTQTLLIKVSFEYKWWQKIHTHTQSTTPTILCRQSSLIQLRVRSSDNGQALFNSILLHNFYSLSDKLIIRCNRRSCNEVDGMMDSIKMTFCNELFKVTTTTWMVAAILTWKRVNRFHRFLRNGDKIYFFGLDRLLGT